MLVTLIVFSPLFGAREKEVDSGFLRFVAGLLLEVFVDGGVGEVDFSRAQGFISLTVSWVCIGPTEHFYSALRETEHLLCFFM